MSLSGNTAPNNSPAGGPLPLWRRLAKPFLRWPITIGICILSIFIAKNVGGFLAMLISAVFADIVIRLRLRNYEVDVRDEIRALNDRKVTRRYRFCTWVCRSYFTVIFCLTAVLGAENWLIGALLLVVGLTIDAVRARWSPDLWLDIRQIAESSATSPPRMKFSRASCVNLFLWLGFPAYMIFLLSVARPSQPDSLQQYIMLFEPLHDLTALFLGASRRVVGQLNGAGLPDRAVVAAHVFTVCWLFVIIIGILSTSGAYPWMLRGETPEEKASGFRRNTSPIWAMIIVLLVAVGTYWILFDALSVNFSAKRTKSSFHVHESNGPYHIAVGWSLLIAICLIGLYGMLLNLRIALWRGWQERLSPKVPLGDM